MTRRTEVLVVGAGIIGAAVADALAREGARVLVVDRGRPGHGCSYGNAGWVTPCFATPLPRPGLLWTALRWMADPASPFYVRPRPDPALARWLLGFAVAMRAVRFRAGTEALVALSRHSLAAYAELERTCPGGVGMQRQGLLQLALGGPGLETAHGDLDLMRGLGVAGRLLDAEGVRALEPAVNGRIAGGVYYRDEAHLEPLAAVRALLARARTAGAQLAPGAEVIELRADGGRVRAVRTTRGWVEADQVVLATGAWSAGIARTLGLRVPVLGGKGYSMTTAAPDPAPRIPMMVVERKVAITPYGDRLRLAGTLELVRDDVAISPRRLDGIWQGAAAVLDLPAQPRVRDVWRGLRPCTPDGLPIIGRPARLANLVLATGHQMLGLQTAPATGRLAADLVLGRTPAFDPQPFAPDRF